MTFLQRLATEIAKAQIENRPVGQLTCTAAERDEMAATLARDGYPVGKEVGAEVGADSLKVWGYSIEVVD